MQPSEVLDQGTLSHLLQLPWLTELVDTASLPAQQYHASQQVAKLTQQQMGVIWRVSVIFSTHGCFCT